MPRQARIKSSSGIYHIMLRGINGQQIFEDDEDCEKFLQVLKDCKAISGYKLYAYCLMGNHVHILLQEVKEPLELLMKRITTRFVYWYNIKYRRAGHLFQDRFKSEPVESDSYFLTVLRYIHQNPIKSGLCKKAEQYSYSSINEYLTYPNLVDTEFTYSLITKEQFIDFHKEENSDLCLEMEEQFRLTDAEAKLIIQKITKCKTITEFQALDKTKRNLYIQKLFSKGLSIRQISRLTGVSKKIVETSI